MFSNRFPVPIIPIFIIFIIPRKDSLFLYEYCLALYDHQKSVDDLKNYRLILLIFGFLFPEQLNANR
jgi:hypothetical protein